MRALPTLVFTGLIAAAACSKDKNEPPPDLQSPAAPASPLPGPAESPLPPKFTREEFRRLGWLEGTWRGTSASGSPFYESYHVRNDSMIAVGGHTDSTFKTKSDSAMIMLRDGGIYHTNGSAVYLAAVLDSNSVDFKSRSSKNHFLWTRNGRNDWTARIVTTKADGTERVTVYQMKRVAAPAVR